MAMAVNFNFKGQAEEFSGSPGPDLLNLTPFHFYLRFLRQALNCTLICITIFDLDLQIMLKEKRWSTFKLLFPIERSQVNITSQVFTQIFFRQR